MRNQGGSGDSLLKEENQLLSINRLHAVNIRPPPVSPTVSHLVLLVSVLLIISDWSHI